MNHLIWAKINETCYSVNETCYNGQAMYRVWVLGSVWTESNDHVTIDKNSIMIIPATLKVESIIMCLQILLFSIKHPPYFSGPCRKRLLG